jgi:hypothetical protein
MLERTSSATLDKSGEKDKAETLKVNHERAVPVMPVVPLNFASLRSKSPSTLFQDEKQSKEQITKTEEKKSESALPWVKYEALAIQSDLFKRGILATKAYNYSPKTQLASSHSFYLGSRNLSFPSKEEFNKRKAEVKKIKSLREALLPSSLKDTANAVRSASPVPANTAEMISQFVVQPMLENDQTVIFNTKRREEIFVPFVFDMPNDEAFGLYMCPWLSHNGKFTFKGFNQFVVAGCMIGSRLKGLDDHGARFDLIKHDIKFWDKQKITQIIFEQDANPYEEMLFFEFERLAYLMAKLSCERAGKNLYYHLPYYDYMLFGVELFIRGRMTLDALGQLFKIIFEQKDVHIEKIRDICKKYDIQVIIESPFENLFGQMDYQDKDESAIVSFVLKTIGLPFEELPPQLDASKQKEAEKLLVHRCVELLQKHCIMSSHQQVWKDFVESIGIDKINNLEDLFKVANAIMIALAAKDKPHYAVCSLLPLSEKQIQVGYAKHSKSKLLSKKYPPIFNLTYVDPLVTYAATCKGLAFYFEDCREQVKKVIVDKDIGLLQLAHQNIARLARGQKVESVESKLPASSSPRKQSPSLPSSLPSLSSSLEPLQLSSPLNSTNDPIPTHYVPRK